jgi:predicted phosphodiesterase
VLEICGNGQSHAAAGVENRNMPRTDFVLNSFLSTFILDHNHRRPQSYLYVHYPSGESTIVLKEFLPEVPLNTIRIIVVGDTHDRHQGLSNLPPCDLFVHCGDVLMLGRYFSNANAKSKLKDFNEWLSTIPARKRIVIAGNHDHHFMSFGKDKIQEILTNCVYLENDGIEFQGLKIWGTPLSTGKSQNKAFQSKEFQKRTLDVCPSATDILITHGHHPEVQTKVKHKIHFCGHKHNSYGIQLTPSEPPLLSMCAPLHDGHFRFRHLPMIIDFPLNGLLPEYSMSEKLEGTAKTGMSEANLFSKKVAETAIIYKKERSLNQGGFPSFLTLFWNRDNSRKILPINFSSRDELER